jgi:hypothetical protein
VTAALELRSIIERQALAEHAIREQWQQRSRRKAVQR